MEREGRCTNYQSQRPLTAAPFWSYRFNSAGRPGDVNTESPLTGDCAETLPRLRQFYVLAGRLAKWRRQ